MPCARTQCFGLPLLRALTLLSFSFLSQGLQSSLPERLFLPGQSLSVIPPEGWDVLSQKRDNTLIFAAPVSHNAQYRANLQILRRRGSLFIDRKGAEDFRPELELMGKSNLQYQRFEVREAQLITLRNLTQGFLFYTSLTVSGIDIMQAHLIISSADEHFLLSFSDAKKNFTDVTQNPNFQRAWQAMISAELKTTSPGRFDDLLLWSMVITAFGVLWFLTKLLRKT